MFTGIIESLGTIKKIHSGKKSSILTIQAHKNILEDTKLGDSIATNGVCLTVIHINGSSFDADVMFETMKITTLSKLIVGDIVNLERALKLSDRLGGHIVSGHIDGIGTIIDMTKEDISTVITIQAPQSILKYIILRGSITIDGISLTVIEVSDHHFKVSIIPHTTQETNLSLKKTGDITNLENDILAKYVEKLLNNNPISYTKTSITEEFLRENGF